jgi:hypothetical protein
MRLKPSLAQLVEVAEAVELEAAAHGQILTRGTWTPGTLAGH